MKKHYHTPDLETVMLTLKDVILYSEVEGTVPQQGGVDLPGEEDPEFDPFA